MAGLKGRLRKRIERCGLKGHLIVAAIDYSLNEHSDGIWKPYWQPHLTLWVFGLSPNEARKLFKKHFSAVSHNTKRPIRCEEVDATGIASAATYLLKARYSRRVTLREKRVKPRHYPLTAAENKLLPLLRALSSLNVRDRLILIGCRFDGKNIIPTTSAT